MTALVATLNTYPGSRAAWLRARYPELLFALVRSGAPLDLAYQLARVIVTLWNQESGSGRGERNFNAGNLHGTGTPDAGEGWNGDVYQGTDAAELGGTQVPVRFRAYGSAADAAADTIQLLTAGVYRPAWADLATALATNHDPAAEEAAARAWYDAITRAGYHPWVASSTDEFVRLWQRLGAA